jgi:multiple sugar transport system ATP-binding protein
MTMADKIVVMEDGYIRQIGAPLDLYDRPSNRFVAGFIGSPSMNMLEGTVRLGDSPFVEVLGTPLPIADASGLRDGQPVVYGVRPEHLNLGDEGLPVTISVIEPTGSETHVVSRFGSAEIVSVFRERHALLPDQTIHLAVDRARAHLFDPESGERIGG